MTVLACNHLSEWKSDKGLEQKRKNLECWKYKYENKRKK